MYITSGKLNLCLAYNKLQHNIGILGIYILKCWFKTHLIFSENPLRNTAPLRSDTKKSYKENKNKNVDLHNWFRLRILVKMI